MATLNLPAWGYGLRYRYGLFKQRISKEGQEEVAEDWLEVWSLYTSSLRDHSLFSLLLRSVCWCLIVQKFSPWEVVRHDIVYPIRFFGHVEVSPTGWSVQIPCRIGDLVFECQYVVIFLVSEVIIHLLCIKNGCWKTCQYVTMLLSWHLCLCHLNCWERVRKIKFKVFKWACEKWW